MTFPRKICVVTGSRAEYGLLNPLMKQIASDPDLKLQVAVTGMHLSPEFGLTYRQIEADEFVIDAKVEMLLSSDTSVGVAKSMGLGIIGFAEVLERLEPDILVILGDRFEALSAAQAALVARIPIAHIHGGETSEGAFDEGIRHAITKMAQWHFVAAAPYRKRIIQMGESPERVFNFGAPGLDQLSHMDWLGSHDLSVSLDIELSRPLFLVTYHPVTLTDADPAGPMSELLTALASFDDATVIFTYPNADTGGRALIELIDRFVARRHGKARAFASLGQQRYLSLMRQADVIVGNSSSGLIEAPALKKASVNIGDRQKGRLRATSVIDAPEVSQEIAQAIQHAMSESFLRGLPNTISPYGHGDVSRKITTVLKTVSPSVRKAFFNIEHDY